LNRSPYGLIALTMCGTLALSRANFLASLEKFPPQRKVVRSYAMWMAVKRGLARELRKEAREHGPENTNGDLRGSTRSERADFFRSMSEGVSASLGDHSVIHDEDFSPQVATVADLNAAVRNLETLLEKQRVSLTDMINTHMLRRWQGFERESKSASSPRAYDELGNSENPDGYQLRGAEEPMPRVQSRGTEGTDSSSRSAGAVQRPPAINPSPRTNKSGARTAIVHGGT